MVDTNRLMREYESIRKKRSPLILGVDPPKNIKKWYASILGPVGSPYEGGVFRLEIDFGQNNYPTNPPKVTLLTNIFHPNICRQSGAGADNWGHGYICVNVLKADWHPSTTVHNILVTIANLLTQPNPNSPTEREIAILLINDPRAFYKTAREWTAKYASQN